MPGALNARSHGLWSMLGEPHTLRMMAGSGFDWVCLDAQHGRWDDAGMLRGLELVAGTLPVLVRTRSGDAGLIGRALDAGAAGVIVPMIDDAEQAAGAVRAARYPPVGHRSWGPINAAYSDDGAVSEPLLAVMIETPTALRTVDVIASVPGVDMLFIGPFDLARGLGVDLTAVLADDGPLPVVVAAARAAGISTGAFAGTPERARRLRELGFDLLAAATEAELLMHGSEAVRSALDPAP